VIVVVTGPAQRREYFWRNRSRIEGARTLFEEQRRGDGIPHFDDEPDLLSGNHRLGEKDVQLARDRLELDVVILVGECARQRDCGFWRCGACECLNRAETNACVRTVQVGHQLIDAGPD